MEQRLGDTAVVIMIGTVGLSFHVNFNFFRLQVFGRISHFYFLAGISGHCGDSFEV